MSKINEKHEKHAYFIKPRKAADFFGIKHYAGEVSYEIKGFLEKNKDEASELMFAALATSQVIFFPQIFNQKSFHFKI